MPDPATKVIQILNKNSFNDFFRSIIYLSMLLIFHYQSC